MSASLNVEIRSHPFPEGTDLDDWRGLLENAEFASPFQTRAWMESWWNHFGKGQRPALFLIYDGSDLVGGLATYVAKGPWRTLRAVGTGQSDYLHALARKGYASRVREALWDAVAQLDDLDLVDFHQWREDVGPGPDECERLCQATCLSIDLPGSFEQYLSTVSKSLRFDCRRLDKKPFSDGRAWIIECVGEDVRRGIAQFFDLHAKRWKRRGLPGAFALKGLREFHMEATARMYKDDVLRLSLLETNEGVVGAMYAMQVGSSRFFYQCGFDPEQKALSPGTLMVAQSIKSAIEEGCRTYDLMRGDEPYKRRWNPQHARSNLRYILSLSSTRGEVGKRLNNAAAHIEAKVRNRLEGRGLFR